MSTKSRPSLKNYLTTGKVIIDEKTSDNKEIAAPEPSPIGKNFVDMLTPSDAETWGAILSAGAEIERIPLEITKLREFFRTMDRGRFTLYKLEAPGGVLKIVRSGVQIREPYRLFLMWDDKGIATLHVPNEDE